jgi:hypothetical protein
MLILLYEKALRTIVNCDFSTHSKVEIAQTNEQALAEDEKSTAE